MKRPRKFGRIAGGILVGSLILSFGSSAFAATAADSASNMPPAQCQKADGDLEDGRGPGPRMNFEAHFAQFVEKGIITEEQADKWAELCKAKAEERKAEMEKIRAMTEAEREAYFAENKKERISPVDEAVNAGVITQEQAEQIAKLMPQGPQKPQNQ